jgi:hypothetical protein
VRRLHDGERQQRGAAEHDGPGGDVHPPRPYVQENEEEQLGRDDEHREVVRGEREH